MFIPLITLKVSSSISHFFCRRHTIPRGLTSIPNYQTFRDVCVNIPGGGNRTHAGRREDVDCAHAVAYHSASHRADDPAAPRGVDEACGTCLELPEVYEVEDSEQPLVSPEIAATPHIPISPQYHDHDGRLDMVGAVTVDVLSVYSDDSSEETFCLQNDHLLELQLDRRNLVLDSLHPEIAPHIVITPPDDGWDYYWAIWTNRVGLQDDAFLTIQQEQSPCPYATLPPTEDADGSRAESNTQSQAVSEIHEQTISSHLLELQKVFSHSHFLRADRQAVFLNHIVVALWRQQYKAACIAASLAAASFRARWDSPKFVEQHEMSFRWTDPAEDLLAFFNHCPGTTIIDSVYPCTAPHIVIQEAPPPADPWALWANTTSSPQDYGYGQLLTIPSSFVAFVNVDYMSCADSCDGYCPTPDGTTAPSPPASDVPFPHTPDRDIFDPNLDTLDESMPPDLATEGTGPSKAKDVPLSEDMVCSGCDIFDEDDDGLPPFDEWYQDIAQRAR
ncbi:hypothetical protein B0H21DRAFT_821051 [Amylocystis lapponica]|nr:hypothetical protein B0H21DRAFT_821051 [Amylocystis lapponica]